MSIIIKKKKYNKKRLIIRIIFLILIYFASFFALYAIFGEKQPIEKIPQPKHVISQSEGEQALIDKNYPKAIQYYRTEIDNNPDNYKAMTQLAIAYVGIKEYDRAKFYFFKSRELVPEYSLNYVELTKLYLALDEPDMAEDIMDLLPLKTRENFIAKGDFFAALAKQDNTAEDKIVNLNRALTYYKKQDEKKYNATVTELLKNYYEVADKQFKAGDTKSAVGILKIIEKYQNTAETHNKLAIVLLDRNPDAAINHLKQAIILSKTHEEKLATKVNLINIINYFDKRGESFQAEYSRKLLNMLEESLIPASQKFFNIVIEDEKLEFKKEKGSDDIFAFFTFKVKNLSANNLDDLRAKVLLLDEGEEKTEEIEKQIIDKKNILKPQETTTTITIKTQKPLSYFADTLQYTATLSFSKNQDKWQIYRTLEGSNVK